MRRIKYLAMVLALAAAAAACGEATTVSSTADGLPGDTSAPSTGSTELEELSGPDDSETSVTSVVISTDGEAVEEPGFVGGTCPACDYSYNVTIDDSIAAAALVAVVRVIDEPALSDRFSIQQRATVSEVIFGSDVPAEVTINSFVQPIEDWQRELETATAENPYYMPAEGFGGLLAGQEYLVFLSYGEPVRDEATPMIAPFGAGTVFRIDDGVVVANTIGPDSLLRSDVANALPAAGAAAIYFDRVSSHLDGLPLGDAVNEISIRSLSFEPKQDPAHNFNMTLSLNNTGPLSLDGSTIHVVLHGGAANSSVLISNCRVEAESISDCDVANYQSVWLDAAGRAEIDLFVQGRSLGQEHFSCADVPCAVTVGQYTAAFAAVPISFAAG